MPSRMRVCRPSTLCVPGAFAGGRFVAEHSAFGLLERRAPANPDDLVAAATLGVGDVDACVAAARASDYGSSPLAARLDALAAVRRTLAQRRAELAMLLGREGGR